MKSLIAIVREPDFCWDDGPGYVIVVRLEKTEEWATFLDKAIPRGQWAYGDELNPVALFFRRFFPFYIAPSQRAAVERIAKKHELQIAKGPGAICGCPDERWWEDFLKGYIHVRDWDTPDEDEPVSKDLEGQGSLF